MVDAGPGADWSPDGQSLVFDAHPLLLFNFDPVVSNLYTSRTDGSGLRRVTAATTPDVRYAQPHWTPTGQIIFTRVDPAGRALWLTTTRGDQHSTAPGGRSIRTHPDWQPNCTQPA